MDNFLTIFYSNYSGNCKALLQYIQNLNLMDKLAIKFINIDSDNVRKLIMHKFNQVPAMVATTGDEVSLFVGKDVFEWFNIFEEESAKVADAIPDPTERRPIPLGSGGNKSILELAAEISNERETNAARKIK
jgi:hypothetical protein